MSDIYHEVIHRVYDKLGYTLDKEVVDILLDKHQHKLVKAPAGGTKTTLSQMWVCLKKLEKVVDATKKNREIPRSASTSYFSSQIQSYVYNKHNTDDIHHVHSKMYEAFKSLGLLNDDPNHARYSTERISVSTLHAFAMKLVKDNLSFLKLRSAELTRATVLESTLFSLVERKYPSTKLPKSVWNELYALYTNLSMYTGNHDSIKPFLIKLGKFELEVDDVVEIFQMYDLTKSRLKMFDFSDYIKHAITLMDIPEVRKKVTNKIDIIVADEIQDFTVLMFDLFRRIVSDDAQTLAIGDPDQTLYEFNGASLENIARYNELTGLDAVPYQMTTNRRCRDGNISFALNILKQIQGREYFPIKTVKKGGTFSLLPYKEGNEAIETIIQEYQGEQFRTTAVLYRNRNDSIALSRALYEKKIPTSYINSSSFVTHKFYSQFIYLMNNLFVRGTRDTWQDLFKVLPFSKTEMTDFLGLDKKGQPMNFPDTLDWRFLDFGPLLEQAPRKHGAVVQLLLVQEIGLRLAQLPTKKFMAALIQMFYKNYYEFVNKGERDIYLQDIMSWLEKDLSGERNLSGALSSIVNVQRTYVNPASAKSLTVSTIHGAKGSEYERVIIGNFEEPMEQDSIDIGDHNSEARVFYVAATRHMGRLVVLYNENYPHTLLTGIINSNHDTLTNGENAIQLQQQTGNVDIDSLTKNLSAPIFSRKRIFSLGE